MTKRAEWAKRVKALQQSGLTAREYAAQIGVNAHALMNWRWRLGQKSTESEARVNFVEFLAPKSAGAVAERSKAEPFEVCLLGDVRVRVPMRFEAESLRDLLAVLGAR